MAVCCQLHAMRKTFRKIVHEVISAARVALANEPARNEFGVGVQRHPRPNVARAFSFMLDGTIFLFRINKTPNLIALNALRFQIYEYLVLIIGTGATKIAQKL